MYARNASGLSIFSSPKSDSLVICFAKKGDLPALSDISKKTYLETYPAANLTDELLEKIFGIESLTKEFENPAITFYLAFNNNELCGYAKVKLKEDRLFLDKLYLLKSHQNKGIGSKLMKLSLEHALSHNLNKLELEVYCENKTAIAFYQKHGLVQTGTLPFHAPNGVVVPNVIHVMTINEIKSRLNINASPLRRI